MNTQTKTHHYNNQFCNNCGKNGHVYSKCTKPITSVGVIAFNKYGTTNSLRRVDRHNRGHSYFAIVKYKHNAHYMRCWHNIWTTRRINTESDMLTAIKQSM